MSRNTNPYFRFYFRDYAESERVRRMPLAAQGLYMRMLCEQAKYGSVPADRAELAMLIWDREGALEEHWETVKQFFDLENTSGEDRYYNAKLREDIEDSKRVSLSKVRTGNKNAKKTQTKRKDENVCEQNASLRASESVSISQSVSNDDINTLSAAQENSDLRKTKRAEKDAWAKSDFGFDAFWNAYPKKNDKKRALAKWLALKPSPELADRIIADVASRSKSDEWVKEDGKFIPYPERYISHERWEDEGVKGLPPAPSNNRNQQRRDEITQHDPNTPTLTPEEQAETAELFEDSPDLI